MQWLITILSIIIPPLARLIEKRMDQKEREKDECKK